MQQGEIVPLNAALALHAAKLSTKLKLPLVDSLIYTTALRASAQLWTQDADFEGLAGVRYIAEGLTPRDTHHNGVFDSVSTQFHRRLTVELGAADDEGLAGLAAITTGHST